MSGKRLPVCVLAAALLLPAAGLPPAPASAGGVTVAAHDLGVLSGDISSIATDANSRGDVVGVSTDLAGENHAVVWRGGQIHALPGTADRDSAAFGVNENGAVVGRVGQRAALWRGGRLVDLGTLPGGTSSQAEDVNAYGVAVGYSNDAAGKVHPVAWWRGEVSVLDLPPGHPTGRAGDVNDRGTVVGAAGLPVRWVHGVPTLLGALPGDTFGEARAVNERNVAVGFTAGADGVTLPVLWSGDSATALPVLDGTTTGAAEDVNRRGTVAGWVQAGGRTRAVLWRSGRLLELSDSTSSGQALAVADAGTTVGWATYGPAVHATSWRVLPAR